MRNCNRESRMGGIAWGGVQAIEVVVEAVARRLLSLELNLRVSRNGVS